MRVCDKIDLHKWVEIEHCSNTIVLGIGDD